MVATVPFHKAKKRTEAITCCLNIFLLRCRFCLLIDHQQLILDVLVQLMHFEHYQAFLENDYDFSHWILYLHRSAK